MTQPKWWKLTLILGTLAAGSFGLAGANALAQTPVAGTDPDFPRGKISGYVFGDYYYNVSGDPGHSYNASGADSAKVNLDGSPYANGQPKVIVDPGHRQNRVGRQPAPHSCDRTGRVILPHGFSFDGKCVQGPDAGVRVASPCAAAATVRTATPPDGA